ncbi:hypothetical protein [Oceanobacillus damuensis]|uniref:hypothetical protein n=1 Tax=Oceanobacillus damuensis TaxID=937928 RepID=UPI00082ADE5D|nr:hypothetical protein [Oceanobacillus damuensis]
MSKTKFLLIVFLSLFLIILGGCSTGKEITLEQAKEIALEDAPKFKPDNKSFEIWEIEETNRGWIIMISSSEPKHEKPTPNILYEVGKSGSILDRENMAIAE